MVEMAGRGGTAESGGTSHQHAAPQGPACAIAAGAATIYRNYFAPVGGSHGQAADRQLDGLADLGEALTVSLKQPVGSLWEMRNGYALCSSSGLDAISALLERLPPAEVDALRGKIRIGIHSNVEVTDADGEQRPVVSQ